MVRRKAKVAVLGGTFDHFHVGHRRLLDDAFRRALRVGIGITTAPYLAAHGKRFARRIQPFGVRRANLVRYLRSHYPGARWEVVPLEDPVGGALRPEVELVVASEETRPGARRINALRRTHGLAPARLHFVPIVLADDLLPLSSTRIRAGRVDAAGRRVRPVRIARRSGLALSLRRELDEGIRAAFPWPVAVRWVDRRASPRGRRRSEARQEAARVRGDAEYGVGVSDVPRRLGAKAAPVVALADETGPIGSLARPRARAPSIGAQLATALRRRRARWVGTPPSARQRR